MDNLLIKPDRFAAEHLKPLAEDWEQTRQQPEKTGLPHLSTAMQVMGANGLLRENPLARQMSGARVTYYMDGTTEIQNVVIGRSLLD
ncbi:MAG: acyl-CoA dehydrogenase family protein [Deltaproteobacteria bacterium]|nr:acyl-CoA dehydrogenase family protein [Deltaproteobacteria bacterium]